jgi:hypothetical protein
MFTSVTLNLSLIKFNYLVSEHQREYVLALPVTHQRFVGRRASYSLELVEVEPPSCNKIKLRHFPKQMNLIKYLLFL